MRLTGRPFASGESVRGARRLMMSRNPLAHLLFHFGIFRIIRKVAPFPLVLLVIIQLFCPVSINDVPVSFGSNAVVLLSEGRYRVFVPAGLGILHQHG